MTGPDLDKDLRDLPAEGKISLYMSARNTERNQAIYDSFREFAEVEWDNDYTDALFALLRHYEQDARMDVLEKAVSDVEERVSYLEGTDTSSEEESPSESTTEDSEGVF